VRSRAAVRAWLTTRHRQTTILAAAVGLLLVVAGLSARLVWPLVAVVAGTSLLWVWATWPTRRPRRRVR
jgi:hypothetical protein